MAKAFHTPQSKTPGTLTVGEGYRPLIRLRMTAAADSMKISWQFKFGFPSLQPLLQAVCCTAICWLWLSNAAYAGLLADRLAAFPDWDTKPAVQPANGDLEYPDWLAGTWTMTSTLVELAAPLAPAIVTPGFDSNQKYLNQPIACTVRFVLSHSLPTRSTVFSLLPLKGLIKDAVVSDRAFNGFNLAKAYLGDSVLAVTVDPRSPNRQITLMDGGRQLISVVTARAVETPDANDFLTTELFQQVFRGVPNPYLNQVETTTAYHRLAELVTGEAPVITADQVTAIYLSPQDEDYFKAVDRPVALYRYQLEFVHVNDEGAKG
ncbi:MAG: DUF6816 family protein [Stenomitos frigidus ULC029]